MLDNPLKSGLVHTGNIYDFVKETIQKRMTGSFSKLCLDALKRGFEATKFEYNPSYEFIHSKFGQLIIPTPHEIFEITRYVFPAQTAIYDGKYIVSHSQKQCVDNIHIIGEKQICILSALKSWLISKPAMISKFLEFVTGSKYVSLSHLKEKPIDLNIINCFKENEMKFPSSFTCVHKLILNQPLHILEVQSKEESYSYFVKMFESAMDLNMWFGHM
jgi:hypothetical protein